MLRATYFGGTTGDYLQYAVNPEWAPAGPFTLYLRTFPLIDNGTLVSRWQGSIDRAFLLTFDPTGTKFNILGSGGSGYGANNGPRLKIGYWQSVAAVFTGNSGYVDCLVDGISGGTTGVGAEIIRSSSMAARIGNRADLSDPFKGYIRDMATWDAALTKAELAALSHGASPLSIRRDLLTGYWPLQTNFRPLVVGTATAPTVAGVVDLSEGEPSGLPFVVAFEVEGGFQVEAATVYLDLNPSFSTDIASINDAATVPLRMFPSAVYQYTDAVTAYLDLKVLGGECYSRFHFTGEGEADTRWAVTDSVAKWTMEPETRWDMDISIQPGCH